MGEGRDNLIGGEFLIDTFDAFFHPNIRVLFNWQRMRKERWPVELGTVGKDVDFSRWYLPWYLREAGGEVGYHVPGAAPVSLSQLPHVFERLTQERQKAIRQLEDSLVGSRRPIQLVVPRYALGGDSYFLLDNCHRMAALVNSKLPFVMLAFTVLGPMDRGALPDLLHWER